jgi:hypothetical protein
MSLAAPPETRVQGRPEVGQGRSVPRVSREGVGDRKLTQAYRLIKVAWLASGVRPQLQDRCKVR